MKSHPYFNDFRLKLEAQESVRMAYRAVLVSYPRVSVMLWLFVTLGKRFDESFILYSIVIDLCWEYLWTEDILILWYFSAV